MDSQTSRETQATEVRYRIVVTGLLVCAFVVSGLCVAASLEWVGRPFNGFLMSRNRLVAAVAQPYWSGPKAGVPYGAQLVAIEGKPVRRVADALAAAGAAGVGAPLGYTFQLGNRTIHRTVPVIRFTGSDYLALFANHLFNGLAFLSMGFLVAYLRPRLAAARAMLVLSLSFGMSFMISLADFDRFYFRTLYSIAAAAAPAAVLYLAAAFPGEHPWLRRRGARTLLWCGTALIAATDIALYNQLPHLWIPFLEYSRVWLFLALALAAVMIGHQYKTAPGPLGREKIKVLFLGTGVAFAFPAAALLVGHAVGAELPENLLGAVTWVFPATLAYAIVKRDLFEIDVFLRRATAYVALSGAVFLFYAGVVALLSRVFHSLHLAGSPWFTLFFTLAIVVLIRPLWDRLQGWVDRIFFRTRFDYAEIIQSVSQALTRTLDTREITAHVRHAVAQTMAPTGCVLYRHGSGEASLRCDDEPETPLELGADAIHALAAGQILDPPGFALLVGQKLPADAALLVPLCFENRLEGVLVLGAKKSGAVYGPRDLELLRTLANQTAIALRNANSYRRVTELLESLETRVEERTRQLREAQLQLVQAEKLASLGTLVAGVAHEINNPVSFISSSIDLIAGSISELRRLLDEQLGGNGADHPALQTLRERLDVEDRFAALEQNAAICRDGALRAARIVTDLRTFSRPGSGQREAADLHETLDRSLRLLQGEYKHRVTIHRDYGALPRVFCDAGQIGQVFMNLLANAIQAIEGAGTVSIRTRPLGATVRVEIEDSGQGMDGTVLARMFDPFFTTKRVGAGTGLGLSICRSLIAAHGGSIEARSTPGRGSVFVVTLPVNGAFYGSEPLRTVDPDAGRPRRR